ncbi:MAG: hypothetical protein IT560_04230, partial [Alphaproteobacteria bacterium]|nr:hypothetical protein [Alphaproteobacteria bacterium]
MTLPDAFNTETPAGQLRLAVRVEGTEQLAALLALKPDRTTMTKPMQDAVSSGRTDMVE